MKVMTIANSLLLAHFQSDRPQHSLRSTAPAECRELASRLSQGDLCSPLLCQESSN
jgi:hypothetical protein